MSDAADRRWVMGRRALWALAAATLAAASVFVLVAGRQAGIGRRQPPPVIAELAELSMVNRDERVVTLDDLAGRPWVANLIFTRCTFSCPRMTLAMKLLGPDLARSGGARRVSISVDPGHDSPEVLARYADDYEVADPGWLFLTGEREAVHRIVREGFLLALEDSPGPDAPEEVLHSTRFILVDAESRIRGYYDAFRPADRQRLLDDVAALNRGR